VCKNSSQRGSVQQLLSSLFKLEKKEQVSKLLGGGGGRNFCPCVAPWSHQLGGANDPILADALADALLH